MYAILFTKGKMSKLKYR